MSFCANEILIVKCRTFCNSEALKIMATSVSVTAMPLCFVYLLIYFLHEATLQSDPHPADSHDCPAKSKRRRGGQSHIIKAHCDWAQLVEMFGGLRERCSAPFVLVNHTFM